jgi:tRNA threonylcarbamoyladenosine biosynthesis protein TsaB
MQEAYCGVYRNDDEVSEIRAPALEAPAALPEIARAGGVSLVAGDALSTFAEVWVGLAGDRDPGCRGSAAEIARLARIDLLRDRAVRAAEAMPAYVRDRVALTIDERRRRVVS